MKEHRDSNNLGPSVAISVGDYTGGSLVVDGIELDTRGKVVEFDGRDLHYVAKYKGHRASVIAFNHDASSRLTDPLRDELRDLGFKVGTSSPAPAPSASRPSSSGAQSAPPRGSMPWTKWSDVPAVPPEWAKSRRWGLEVFAGAAGLTGQLQESGFDMLPPIDLTVSAAVQESFDVLRPGNVEKILAWVPYLTYCHFGI